MTSRLKRKLGEMGIDPSSSRANESFCLIGTPLPPLEKSKDTGEFVPLWKQEVRDEKGRRRLHGAFTGGFSAGYFNTVGSKEGWAPSTFTSSRSERAKKKTLRPEDFMDEEDLQDIKDSRNIVDTTEEMDITGGTAAEKKRKLGGEGDDEDEDSIATILASTMSQPPSDSAGARILKKMGWKFGQGIGPRVTWRQRRQQDLQAGAVAAPNEDEEEASKHMYAPRDTPLVIVGRKDNTHGLGYTPGLSLHETNREGTSKSSGPNLSAGFGLGALNEADEDDLDVYDSGPKSGRSRIAYDIAERPDDDSIIIGGKSDRRKTTQPIASSSTQVFRDGRPVLKDFILSDKPVEEDRWFPLPDIPPGWKPDPKRVWSKDQNKENVKSETQLSEEAALNRHRKSGITADERGQILGETPLPSAPRSVFEFMSQKDRERLKNIASQAGQKKTSPHDNTGGSSADSRSLPSQTPSIPPIDPHIAQSALAGFQPFSTNPSRHARYTAYLRSHLSTPTHDPLSHLPNQSIDEFNREMDEYKKSAMMFKPVSGAMAGRFRTAVVVEMGENVGEGGLHTPAPAPELHVDDAGGGDGEEERKAQAAKEAEERDANAHPKVNAAKMGMYGPMTREAIPWQPTRLLCKRFGVKDPNPAPPAAPDASTSAAPGPTAAETAAAQEREFTGGMSFTPASESATSGGKGRKDIANIGMGDDEEQGKDILTYERPSMDIFQAIFASDDEESDDDDEGGADDKDKDGEPKVKIEEQAEGMEGIEPTTVSTTTTSVGAIQAQAPAANANEPVDLASFKPTFIPRENGKSKSKKSSSNTEDKDKEKKDKKRKNKGSKMATVSFQMDEEGGDELQIKPSKDRPKKKKKREEKERGKDGEKGEKERKGVDDDDAMWVEKPPPEVNVMAPPPPQHALEHPQPPRIPPVGDDIAAAGPVRGRKRAIDFM